MMGMSRFSYPSARTADIVDDFFGTKVADPYRWLEDPDSPETIYAAMYARRRAPI